jgi:formylglycine-generating enzyme required for sulfatase activity/glutaredoxin
MSNPTNNPAQLSTPLSDHLHLHPVPGGGAILGLEATILERFLKGYGDDWQQFFPREAPLHQVELAPFLLGRYPVTNEIYGQFMAADGYNNPDYWVPEGWAWRLRTNRQAPLHWQDPQFAGPNRPVVGVSWFEATAVARWASVVTGLNLRLPSEAEWEYAARAQNLKNNYTWNGAWDARKLNSGYNDEKFTAVGSTTPVGQFSPIGDAPFGHADMLGQVWEWTNSIFKPYPYQANDGREDRYSPLPRVLRGGNWSDGKYVNRITARYYYPAYYADRTDGFRLAADGDALPLPARPPYDLVVYGRSTFCPDLMAVKRWLNAWNVPYRQLQVDLDEVAAHRLDSWLGSRTVPTLVVAQHGQIDPISTPAPANLSRLRNTDRGAMLHEPDDITLRAFLARHGFSV